MPKPLDESQKLDTLPCTKCKGTGQRFWEYNNTYETCTYCGGTGIFAKPDVSAIAAAIQGRKGLRSKRPDDSRAYYVWRLARFHGGRDVTMPIVAMMEAEGDPYMPTLDVIADVVARKVFGTDLAAAQRWGLALGMLDKPLEGLPASAYPSGPVADEDKPLSELPELRSDADDLAPLSDSDALPA